MERLIQRLLAPFVHLRDGESTTAALMFAYSFLAMTAYNIVKPITRSKFISDLGADNLPWVQLGAGLLIGVLMHGYTRAIAFVPRRWSIPVTQAGCVLLLLTFWALFTAGYEAVSVGFYVLGLLLGSLLISQFWTLANDIYDARDAKRLFGLIGGGASLGGATGAAITAVIVSEVGTTNLLLVAAGVMLVCLALVIGIARREEATGASLPVESEGIGGAEAIKLLRDYRHLQLIAVIVACAAIGGSIVDQQLNMAAESAFGQAETDGITELLAQVTVYLSLIGFLIQVVLTSRIHGVLGIGFALLILPVGLGAIGLVMLFNSALWVPAAARVIDTSFRYTVDKTTREILFLPLPTAVKYRAKPFIDVTMDRFAKALGALLVLVLIKPWGLALSWQQLSYASLALIALWVAMALKARSEYLAAFRRSIARHDVEAGEIRAPHADPQTIELLVEELAHPDQGRVLYAIDLLESLGKRHLVTPLLLHHTSGAVRTRTLQALETLKPDVSVRWLPTVERLLADDDPDVRVAAVRAVAAIRGQDAAALMRGYLAQSDPRLVLTAAVALADADAVSDRDAAVAALQHLVSDDRESAAPIRLEVARALGDVRGSTFRQMLIPLILDPDVDVARAAIQSVSRTGGDRTLYLPPLVSLLRHRRLKEDVRAAIVAQGADAVEPLAHFLRDADEDIWVRRHIPAALAQLPTQRTVDVLVDVLASDDGFLRYQAILALEAVHRADPRLVVPRERMEAFTLGEALRFFNALTLHANLCQGNMVGAGTLLARALEERQQRTRDRVLRLLGLLYPSSDIGAAWAALQHGDSRRRAGAAEYLDNVIRGTLRRRVLLMVEDMPDDERVRRVNLLCGTRPRDLEDTLAQLVHDEDPVIAATAIQLVSECQLWALTDDIEYALAHRAASDWYVFEAASWALAGRRLVDGERRARWLEPWPTVELARQLRRIPVFDYVSVDELFRFAGTARQVRYERGRAVYHAGLQPDSLQFLIDGEVRFDDGVRVIAPGPLAFEEMLEGAPLRTAVRAVDVAVTLSLTQDEFLTLLSDNMEIAQGLFRMLVDARGGLAPRALVRSRLPGLLVGRNGAGLQPMERVLLLQENLLFAGATSAQLVRLAAIAHEVALTPGTVLAGDGENPSIYIVLRGRLTVQPPGAEALSALPGDAVGLYEALSGVRRHAVVTVAEAGEALRIDGQQLFSLLADDVVLMQGLFSTVLRSDPPAGDRVAARDVH